MKRIFEKGGDPFMKEKRTYSNPELDFYPMIFEEDILTTSPTLTGNETPLIFY